jgi:membrane-bound lytic murein transglycosylase B
VSRLGLLLQTLLSSAVLFTQAAGSAPPPRAAIPRDPAQLAQTIVRTKHDLDAAVDAWTKSGARGRPPHEVTLNALYEQRIELLLARRRQLARATVARLPSRLAGELSANLAAKREFWRLTPVTRRKRFATGPALPPATLLRYYREAERRFGVRWNVLAAVNFVESAFNKLRNNSASGAQGPMQFISATWRAYGLGGNVRDPHDAVLGAANYLHANGAPGNNRRALYRYNPSPLYVDAVLRYARRIRSDRRAFYEYYARQVFVRTPAGLRRITGPGLKP